MFAQPPRDHTNVLVSVASQALSARTVTPFGTPSSKARAVRPICCRPPAIIPWRGNPFASTTAWIFCRQPSKSASEAFAYPVPDATRVLMGDDYRAADHLNFGIVPVRDRCQDAIPDSSVTPSNEPIAAGGVKEGSGNSAANRRRRGRISCSRLLSELESLRHVKLQQPPCHLTLWPSAGSTGRPEPMPPSGNRAGRGGAIT